MRSLSEALEYPVSYVSWRIREMSQRVQEEKTWRHVQGAN